MARDLFFFLGGDNLNPVGGEAEKFKAVGSCGTNVIAVLPDAAGENQAIHTAQESGVCTDHLANRNGESIQRKSGPWVVGAGALFEGLDVALAGRESKEAAVMIKQIFKLVGAELLRAKEIEQDARVEIAGTGTHQDPAGGSEAHGGVDRYSIANSAEACSVTEMREDGSFGKLGAEVMHERLDATAGMVW